jgi:predicted acyltransferase
MVIFACCLMKFDIWGWRRLARPWEIVGVNAIFVFVGSGILATGLNRWKVGGQTTREWLYNELFLSWISDPKLASLGYALGMVAFWWLVLWIMWRLGWTIRV